MEYLLQIHIGPVQGFIASARRTRDLWFGSALLSRLAMEAAIALNKAGATLIFPSPGYIAEAEKNKEEQGSEEFSVPNKIVAVVRVENEDQVKELGDSVREAMNEERDRIRNIAYGKVNQQYLDREKADRQIDDLIEYRWVALPYDGAYDNIREELELLMAARKNVYNFQQVAWGASRAKSSIDGKLECVVFNDWYVRRSDSMEKRFEKQAVLYRQFRAGPAERLSGVDLLKRRGDFYEKLSNEKKTKEENAESGFPSTSHIASIPYLARLSKLDGAITSTLQEKWNAYIHALEDLRQREGKDTPYIKDFREQVIEIVKGYHPDKENIYPHPIFGNKDGALLFHEHFLDIVTDKKHLSTSGKALQDFFEAVCKQLGEKVQPQPYYAILLADGDGMGKVIDAQAENDVEGHQALSRQIDDFAKEARKIVRKRLGATIYAGGDDVLALVPLHTALTCAAELSAQFKKLLGSFKDKDDKAPSLSVGVAIVHHLELLSEALDVARRAEKKAKGYQKRLGSHWTKKDALAVIVSKRSGETYDIVGRWGDLDSFLDQLIPLYGDETIPKGTAYALRESMLRLQSERLSLIPGENETEEKQKARAVLLAEAERILQRKLLMLDGKNNSKEKAERALGLLEQRLGITGDLAHGKRDQSNVETRTVEPTATMEVFVHELIIAEMLADAQRLAGTLKKEGK